MLNLNLWTSFDENLSTVDIEVLEKRLEFLRDTLEDAATQYCVEDVTSELDLNLHIYLKYFDLYPDANISAWLIHDSWFYYYSDGVGIGYELNSVLKEVFLQPATDLYLQISGFLKCLNSGHLVAREVDAVVWLSFLDYMASRLIHHIGHIRMQRLFQSTQGNNAPKTQG